jgi:hypothetical protein
VWRRGEANASVLAVIDAFTSAAADTAVKDESAWLPAADPHRAGSA